MSKLARIVVMAFALLVGSLGKTSLAQPTSTGNLNTGNDISELLTGSGEYDFLVEFDVAALKSRYSNLRKTQGLAFNDAALRASFANELRILKQSALGSVSLLKPDGSTLCMDSATTADQITCFSNSAHFLTLLAPGVMINAASFSMGGASQAIQHVSGAVAALRVAYPRGTLERTVVRLTGNGLPITDSRNGITATMLNKFGAVGVINAQLLNAAVLISQTGSAYGNNILPRKKGAWYA